MDIDPSARPAPAIPVVGKPPAEAADAAPTTGKTGVRGKRSVAKLAGPGDPAQAAARQALHLQKLSRLSRFADKKLFANELGVRRRLADLQGQVGSPEFLAQYRQLKVQLKADAAHERLSPQDCERLMQWLRACAVSSRTRSTMPVSACRAAEPRGRLPSSP